MLLFNRWRRAGAGFLRPVLVGLIAIYSLVSAGRVIAETPDVYFAGVAFTGNAADQGTDFPHLSRSIDAGANGRISARIREQLEAHPGSVNLVFDQLGSIKDAAHSTALAMAIDRETTSIERIGNVYKTRLEISMQLLFFDFKEKQVLGGFPVILDYIDTSSSRPSEDDIQNHFDGMILGGAGRHSLVGEFVDTLSHVSIPSAASRRLRVGSITLAPKALSYLQQFAPTVDPAVIRTQVAGEFGKFLAANQNLSMLPYASNQALGGSMAARFVEGEAFQLKIPEADYNVALNVAGFKKIEQGRSDTSVGYLYGAFVDLSVSEPLSGRVYFSQRIKQGAAVTVPVTQTNTDDWAASYDTLLLLFNNFTQAISTPDGSWARSALPRGGQAKAELSSLKGLVQSCR